MTFSTIGEAPTHGSVREGWINLRSDVVTLPTDEMLEAIQQALMGDDNKGEDPSANRLEEMSAELLGKEAAILLTSGTMGNLVGMLSHTEHGMEVIIEEGAHIYTSEQGGAAAIGGLSVIRVKGERGFPSPAAVEALIRPDDIHAPRTGLICLENSHNRAGGTVISAEQIGAMKAMAIRHELPIHLDGARLFNASCALGISARELVKDVDSVTFCLSKGLSCPLGAILAGSKAYIAKARRWRKKLGGGMRQAGLIAAPGIVALQTMVERLAEDNANARYLAESLAAMPGIKIDLDSVQTNIIRLDLSGSGRSAAEVANEMMAKFGVEPNVTGPSALRLVTHRHIGKAELEQTLAAFKAVLAVA